MRNTTDSLSNRLMHEFDNMLKVLHHKTNRDQQIPGSEVTAPELNETQNSHTAGLMRINHTGEVCAQALYNGQAMMAKDEATRTHLLHAAEEEHAHLNWCQSRLDELGADVSKTNAFWYIQSFAVGSLAAFFGDKVSYGFVIETERQVESHLQDHINDIGTKDAKSLAILEQMQADEIRHGEDAKAAGGIELPEPVKWVMTGMSKIMKMVSYRI
ncbi:2-polyprenyl-3-methyl-6-methoxy-1,4-benzoquinone monooxygenase [Marinicella sp. S1101]|uniref:2-polyprenyl-3-methyl-6-methoxy-1,4-benzoquinone monooxygenase n=1 Tax=Marinicella marina TaxID=2996016 RepID=UPI002260FC38|nr:2-polyprenyl-3-methyl-6-methoxy-1,4-benzoquinone monooxygenase [Marinicella marina]MCX7553499.1 2-polyprenyl-3-methyl-6-methoxy-1,4-benzoquinone monooxygenase [Marinicella marina]MDJ1140123.1 2-polyprenyl-3-methyl-6-methoxy-1,4-benzoquinone monooxygenase [Marinicella marina]